MTCVISKDESGVSRFSPAVDNGDFEGGGARVLAMLRITIHEKPSSITFQLEGRLAGRWVRELEECWLHTAAMPIKPNVRVDLAGVTFVDANGQACLMGMHQQGAELVAADCLTKAVVDEITQGHPSSNRRAEIDDDLGI